MIEIPSLTAVLVTEGLIVLVLALLLILFGATRRRKTERGRAVELVNRINESDRSNLAQWEATLTTPGLPIDESLRRQTLEEVNRREKTLYRLVIQAFLDRDAERLSQLDRHVRALSEPFRELLGRLAENLPRQEVGDLQDRLDAAEREAKEALNEVSRLDQKLAVTLATLEEVSNEYGKMFGEPHAGDEMQASRQRVLEAFRRAESFTRGGLPSILDPGHDFGREEAS
jgi:hypothetical protein